jgi:Porphyromonas-type peptidyl-arginine deiminase
MNSRRGHVSLVGICIGLVAAAVVLSMTGRAGQSTEYGPMLSECDGRIRSVAIQYVRGSAFAVPVYRQFLGVLPRDVKVYALCPDQNSVDDLKSAMGVESSRLTPIVTGHAMTSWARDRWISLVAGRGESAGTLVAAGAENGAEIWPQRRGDQRIAQDLARVIGKQSLRSGLFFDGGDLLADSHSVFVAPGAITRNIQHTCANQAELKAMLRRQFGCEPILLADAPDHHVGMFMMAAGNGRVVVGDPSLAKPLFAPMQLPGGADFSSATQRQFDSVAIAAQKAGYRVTRIPCVPSADGKTYISYVNGIIDQRDGGWTIYMPVYRGQDRLNAAGAAVWRRLGYRVMPIDVTSAFRFFGTLHCLVNVVEKG